MHRDGDAVRNEGEGDEGGEVLEDTPGRVAKGRVLRVGVAVRRMAVGSTPAPARVSGPRTTSPAARGLFPRHGQRLASGSADVRDLEVLLAPGSDDAVHGSNAAKRHQECQGIEVLHVIQEAERPFRGLVESEVGHGDAAAGVVEERKRRVSTGAPTMAAFTGIAPRCLHVTGSGLRRRATGRIGGWMGLKTYEE